MSLILTVMYKTDAARWRALSIRDPNANNHFVYTVKSTRIYCRPICPARLARRANVGFCSTPAEAIALGYRACKRCKPDAADTEDPQEKAVTKACELIEEALRQGNEKAFRLQDLAKNVGLTPRYFHKIFKERMGISPKEWTKAKMVEKEGVIEMRTPSLVLDSPLELSSFHSDAFDFDELMNFDMDAELALDMTDTMRTAGPGMVPFDENGVDLDVNTTMLTWDILAPDYQDSGFRIDDKIAKPAAAGDAAVTTTSATFEQDAALILSMGFVPDPYLGAYVNTFG